MSDTCEIRAYRKHNYDDCRWRDVTVHEPRPEAILVRYRDQKVRAPPLYVSAAVTHGNYTFVQTHIKERRNSRIGLYRGKDFTV